MRKFISDARVQAYIHRRDCQNGGKYSQPPNDAVEATVSCMDRAQSEPFGGSRRVAKSVRVTQMRNFRPIKSRYAYNASGVNNTEV